MKLAWVAGLALSLCGCARTLSMLPQRIELTTPRVEVPLSLVGNMLFVGARIDGGPVIIGLLDTGAEMLVLAHARSLAPRR